MNKKTENKKVIVLIDWENIRKSMEEEGHPPTRYSIESAFKNMKKWIESIGEIAFVIVYATWDQIYIHYSLWDSLKFDVRACPRKDGKDATDEYLLNWGLTWLENFKELYCLCLGAGDIDYSKLIKGARKKGVKIAFILGSEDSMSRLFRRLPDIQADKGKKMIHIFPPISQ